MTTKQERIKIIKMLEKFNGLPLVYLDSSNPSYDSIINDKDYREWGFFHFRGNFTIIDSPIYNNIYIVSDKTEYLGRLIVEEGLDYAPLDDTFWWEEHHYDIIDDNLALPELPSICGEGCVSEYERIKSEYMKKSALELKKVPEGLKGVMADWIYTFFAQFKVMAYRAEYVSRETGVKVCIGSIEEPSSWASRYYLYTIADASDLNDVGEKFRVAVYAADPYNAYDDMHGRWYLNKPRFGDPFWDLDEFVRFVREPHLEYEYWDVAIRKILEKMDGF